MIKTVLIGKYIYYVTTYMFNECFTKPDNEIALLDKRTYLICTQTWWLELIYLGILRKLEQKFNTGRNIWIKEILS